MSPLLTRWRKWLRARLAGEKFSRAVARYEQAARELDEAVREILHS